MGKVTILEQTIKNPLSFMGECAGIAYDSDISSQKKNKKRGLSCVRAGHGRMWEFCDIFMKIEGYSIRVMREFMRHVGDGLTVIQRSTRYVEEDAFSIYNKYYTPEAIKKDKAAKEYYITAMNEIDTFYQDLIIAYDIPKEDAANILPLGLDTTVVVKHNARTMIQMAEVRLCNRTYEEYRKLMQDILNALGDYSEEWWDIVQEFFKCKCDKLGCCEEEYCCGKHNKKDEMIIVSKKDYIRLLEIAHQNLFRERNLFKDNFKKFSMYDDTTKLKYSNRTDRLDSI